MTKRWSILFATGSLALWACGDDVEGGDDTDGSGSVATSAGSGSRSGGSAGSSDDGTTSASSGPSSGTLSGSAGDSGSTGEPPLEPAELAGAIRVTDVEVNQGVGILVGRDGAAVPSAERSAPVIAGRDALVRVAYELDPGFAPRDVEARIFVGEDSFVDLRSVDSPADWAAFSGSFSVVVPGDVLDGGDELRVELVEPGGAPTVGTDVGASFEGGALEVWDDRMVIELVVVPMECDGIPSLDISREKLANFEAFLFNTFPVQELNLTVHEPVFSPSCSEFDAAETELPQLRELDGASPWVYYGGLLPGDGAGYSISVEGGDQMDYRRTFANHAWRDEGLTADLFAHELGHNHGRDHSFDDPSFPAETGDWCGPRANHGWGPRSSMMPTSGWSNDVSLGLAWFDPSQNLLAPTDELCDGLPDGNRYNYNDIMSYTYPFWVSAYTYASLAERVRLISTWDEQAYEIPAGTTLRVVVGPNGQQRRIRRAGARLVTSNARAWADCAGSRVPVRVTHSFLERTGDTGRIESTPLVGYELPVPAGDATRTCVLESDRSIVFDTDRF